MDSWRKYYASVFEDVKELKRYYPYVQMYFPPTVKPQLITLVVTAVGIDVINKAHALEKDYLGEYSKKLVLKIPFHYKAEGCEVYGGKWICEESIPQKHRHFNGKDHFGNYLLCVGVPESFKYMKNVILENVKTADRLLVAYEGFQTKSRNSIKLIEYSHGKRGIDEYKKEKNKYTTQ